MMPLRGRGLMALGEGITTFGQQLGSGLEKYAEAKRLEPMRDIQKTLGEQAVLKGQRDIKKDEIAIARAEKIERLKKNLLEIAQDPEGQAMLAQAEELGKKLQTQKPEEMDFAAAEPKKMTELETIKQLQPEALMEPEIAKTPYVKGLIEEKEIGQKIGAQKEAAGTKLMGQFALEEMRQENRKELQEMKNKAKAEVQNVNPSRPGFKVANLEIKFTNQVKSDKRVKDYGVIDQQFSRMATVWDDYITGDKDKKSMIGTDQALIMIFNKMLDPTSVVRESEFARTPQAEAVMERAKGFIPKLRRGGVGLTDRDRQEVVDTAKLLHGAAREGYNKIIDNYRNTFGEYSHLGVNADRVVGSFDIQSTPEEEETKTRDYGKEYGF